MTPEELARHLRSLLGKEVLDPGPRTLLFFLNGAVMFPLSRIMIGLTDEEFAWSPVLGAKGAGWQPGGHDPATDPFTSVAWRWSHFTTSLFAIAGADICLGVEDGWRSHLPPMDTAFSAVSALTVAVAQAATAIATTSDSTLDQLVTNEFGAAARRHWVSLLLVEAVHHAAEIGMIRDLYRLQRGS